MSEHHEQSHGIDTAEHLAEHLAEVLTARSVIVCVGNDLCGDDGAGPAVAAAVEGKVPWEVFDVRGVPENFIVKIVEAAPDTVLLVDALSFDAPPGAVELLAGESITGQGPSTHGPAPVAFLDLLNMMHPCRRVVLGVQPVTGDFGEPMTDPVKSGVDLIVRGLLLAGQAAGAGG